MNGILAAATSACTTPGHWPPIELGEDLHRDEPQQRRILREPGLSEPWLDPLPDLTPEQCRDELAGILALGVLRLLDQQADTNR